jgi:hypothetical protein
MQKEIKNLMILPEKFSEVMKKLFESVQCFFKGIQCLQLGHSWFSEDDEIWYCQYCWKENRRKL